MFHAAAAARVTALRDQFATVEGFANTVRAELDHQATRRHYLNTAAAWPAASCSVR